MEPKPGVKTSELWLGVISAGIALLVGYGYMTSAEKELWTGLAAAAVALAPAIISTGYSISRGMVKKQQ